MLLCSLLMQSCSKDTKWNKATIRPIQTAHCGGYFEGTRQLIDWCNYSLTKGYTCKPRFFTKGTDKLIFLLCRKPQGEIDKNPYNNFLYDELIGKPYLDKEATEGETDTNREDDNKNESNKEIQVEDNVNEDAEDRQGDESNVELQEESGENATVKLIFQG